MTNKHMDGWTVEEETSEVKLGRKTYKNMARVSRPCQTCAKPFEIWITQKAVVGTAANDSLRLRNCEDHRGSKLGPGVGENERLKARVEELETQLGEMDAADSERLDKVHAALVAAGYRVSVDEIAETVRKHIAPANMPWGSK